MEVYVPEEDPKLVSGVVYSAEGELTGKPGTSDVASELTLVLEFTEPSMECHHTSEAHWD